MDLNQVTAPCTDLDDSVAFYRRLGLRQIVSSPPDYARFECPAGSATFSLHRVDRAPADPGVIVYFEVEDLDARVQALQARGLRVEAPPRDQPWLWREAYLRDPAGNLVCLFHAGANRRDPPWRLPGPPSETAARPARAAGRAGSGLARGTLVLGSLVLAAYGVWFLIAPDALARLVGLEFTSPNAPVEIRSFYGGLELGLAAFLLVCARRPALRDAGLLLGGLAFSLAGAARLLGVAQYGFAGPSQPLVGAIELVFAGMCLWLRARGARDAAGGP